MKVNWFKRIIGARTIKTGFATFLTALFCMLLNLNPIFAVITSIVTIEPTAKASLKKAYVRFPASILGALIAVVSTYVFGETALSYSLAATVTILVCYQLKLYDGMLVAALTAVAMVPGIHNEFAYNFFSRLATTTIGLTTAGLVNFLILPPKYGNQIKLMNKNMEDQIIEIFIRRIQEILLGEYRSKYTMSQISKTQQTSSKIEQLIKYQKEEIDYHKYKNREKSEIRKLETHYHTNRLLNIHLMNIIFLPEDALLIFTENEKIALLDLIHKYKHLQHEHKLVRHRKAVSTLKKSVIGLNEFDKYESKSMFLYEVLLINKLLTNRYSDLK